MKWAMMLWGIKTLLGACALVVFGVTLIYLADFLNAVFHLAGESLVP